MLGEPARWQDDSKGKTGSTKTLVPGTGIEQLTIDRSDPNEDKFTDKVGSQFVSTVYHGKATYQADGKPDDVRFICLHAGLGKGAVFVYTLPR